MSVANKSATIPDLRYFQREALDAIPKYFHRATGNPLISICPGGGKSLTMATFCYEALHEYPGTGIISVTSVKELILNNYETLIDIWPSAPATIYSASIGKKDLSGQIVFASIQSIYKKAFKIPRRIDLILVDECQDISEENGTMFRKFISELIQINPSLKIIGFSGTCYRLSQGMLTEGPNALFDEVIYDYGLLQGITDGYLSPLISKSMATKYDLSSVRITKGEYAQGQLEKAVDRDDLTVAVVDELMRYGEHRKCWLVYATGMSHCEHVRDEIRKRGISCEMVTGKTPNSERASIFRRYKNSEIRCLVNILVLQKGNDIPQIDLISMLKPTKSAGRFMQMACRGNRLYPGKKDCLILDHCGLLEEHGPLDRIRPKRKGEKGEGEAPVKTCPGCQTILFAGMMLCPECGHEFEKEAAKIDFDASDNAVLSTQIKTEIKKVTHIMYYRHEKHGKPDSLRVEYLCGPMESYREWVLLEGFGRWRESACNWWRERSGNRAPNTIGEALERKGELSVPKSIHVRKIGKYFEIVGVEL